MRGFRAPLSNQESERTSEVSRGFFWLRIDYTNYAVAGNPKKNKWVSLKNSVFSGLLQRYDKCLDKPTHALLA